MVLAHVSEFLLTLRPSALEFATFLLLMLDRYADRVVSLLFPRREYALALDVDLHAGDGGPLVRWERTGPPQTSGPASPHRGAQTPVADLPCRSE